MNEVIDLDILKPEKRIIILNKKEIDVSFIPCAITFELDDLVQQLQNLDGEKVRNNDKSEIKKAFEISIAICSTYTKHQYPEMTSDWFMHNTNPHQVETFVSRIKEALTEAFVGVERHSKNGEAAQEKTQE